MKNILCLLLAVLLLAGCQSQPAETTQPPETTAAPAETIHPEETTFPTIPATPQGDEIAFENPGKTRITYTGPRSFVMVVSRVEDLPNEEALKGYDEAFFEEHDLVIVVETVSSGSVQLEISGIYRDGDIATVQLKRTMDGDVGTTDMATWMLWAEVSSELDCHWVLDSDSRETLGEKY